MTNKTFLKGLVFAGLFAAAPSLALAADLSYRPVAPMQAPAPAESPFDLLFGATVTSDYISRGASQSDHNPALQGFIELDFYQVYASLWASSIDFSNGDSLETDWTVGWRPTLGPVSLDLGYVRYLFESSSDSSGEAFVKASINPVKPLTLGAQFWIDPDSSNTYIEANAAYNLPYDFQISGAIGAVNASTDYVAWNAGVSWTYKDTITLDARYWDASSGCSDSMGFDCDARIVGSISFNSSFKKLGLIH